MLQATSSSVDSVYCFWDIHNNVGISMLHLNISDIIFCVFVFVFSIVHAVNIVLLLFYVLSSHNIYD